MYVDSAFDSSGVRASRLHGYAVLLFKGSHLSTAKNAALGPVLILITCLLLEGLSGCGTVRLARPDNWTPAVEPKEPWLAPDDAYAVSSAATTVERRTIWVPWWGLNQRNIDPANCLGAGIAEVRVSTNLGYAIVSVLTLGFFQPLTVEWRCAKKPQAATKDF